MPTQPPPPRPASHDVARWLAVGNVVLALVLAFLVVTWRGENREGDELRARDAVASVARTLAEGVNGDMARVDGVLKSAVAAFERAPEDGLAADGALATALSDLRAGILDADALMVCDAEGNVRLGLPKGARAANLADRDFFIAAATAASAGPPIVSKPWVGQVNGKWVVSIARPLRAPDGRFAGTVHADLGSEDFARRLAGVPLGQDGIVALRASDMALIARITTAGVSKEGFGNTTISPALKTAIAAEPTGGHLVSRSPRDGVVRALAYQRVAEFPLYVIVGQGTGDAVADAAGMPGH